MHQDSQRIGGSDSGRRFNYLEWEEEPALAELHSFRSQMCDRAMSAGSENERFRGASHSDVVYEEMNETDAATGIFEVLQRKFGFQQSSVANQKEHFACWVANYRLAEQAKGNDNATYALYRVHQRFFKNYIKWCKFLHTTPRVVANANESSVDMENQIALFLLIWGEAGNLRFMPECICFLYHSMSSKLSVLDAMPTAEEGYYLKEIVRPVYGVISQMRTNVAPEGQKPIDHQDLINYDDVNEFFWRKECLKFNELNVADVLMQQDPKTFREKRSVFNPLLAFFRIWFFLIVLFHTEIAVVYVAYRTDPDSTDGFSLFDNFFDSDYKDIRNHALYSIFITVTGLQAFRAILQAWLHGRRAWRNMLFAIGIFIRLLWHSLFLALFIIINVSPDEDCPFGSISHILPGGGTAGSYMSMGLWFIVIYGTPVVFAGLLRMACVQAIWRIGFLNALDGTKDQYIGRHMAQPWGPFLAYSLSWMIIFAWKFYFSLMFMIKPLVGPSIEIFDLAVSDTQESNSIINNHNMMFIIALWAPIFLVYMYDLQIWFIVYQSVVGLFMGIRMKLGHHTGLNNLKAALYVAPQLFDKAVMSDHAKKRRNGFSESDTELAAYEGMRLRFAIIWNEVVSNFRLNDLLDDRETVILQYRILGKGQHVQEPIFLLAGKCAKAIEIASKTRPKKGSTSALIMKLAKAGVMDGVRNALELLRGMFYILLGEEEEGALSVLDYLYNAPDVASVVDFKQLPALVELIVELLSIILDLPEDVTAMEGTSAETQESRMAFHAQVTRVVEILNSISQTIQLMVSDTSITAKLRGCRFLHATPDLAFQKEQLLGLYMADANAETGLFSSYRRDGPTSFAAEFAREDFISSCTRLFFLLRLDVANSMPRCEEAKRRMGFFLHSLLMEMPTVSSLEAMPSFSVMTPYYSETVLFTLDELKNPVHSNPLFEKINERAIEKGQTELTIIKYLITFHAEEWSNFLERMGLASLEEALVATPTQVRLWASLRGQTLARTVHGMMMYEDAIRLLRWLELYSEPDVDENMRVTEMNHLSALKFSYITGCQIYSQQVAKGDHRAADIDFLMKKFPSWRVSFVDTIKGEDSTRYDCVLVKAEGDEIVEVYRYELPGNPILGEGKPENQNVALPFTRGEYLQTIDMNQEHYFEETIKMPNFLATATQHGEDVTVIGMKEHVFTGRASSLARFMTLQELVFVTMTQRVLAKPLRSRMHYGHPDVFEKSFVMTNGGVSKASKGINLSEDVFSGYNVTLRGGLVTHVEFMQCGKGRDVTLSQINAFEAKLSNGCAESCLSREGHRLSNNLDFFRLNSMFNGHFGFYICNALTVFCVYVYAYAKLYVGTHTQLEKDAIASSDSLDSLASVMTTQYVLQFGMLTILPLFVTLYVEFGPMQAAYKIVELIVTLGIAFYVFLTGTKAHFYDVALIRGGSKYRGTGRGFSITRDPMVNFFKEYGVSHFRKAVELMGIMILYGIYGDFNIGADALEEYCASLGSGSSSGCSSDSVTTPASVAALVEYSSVAQSYGIASFAVLLLGACWLWSPFLFNTDGLVFQKTNIDIANWFAWMVRVKGDEELISDDDKGSAQSPATPKDGWIEWWQSDVELMENLGLMGRMTYWIRELRHPFAMYYVWITNFSLVEMPLLFALIGGVWFLLWSSGRATHCTVGKNQRANMLTIRGGMYMVCAVGGISIIPVVFGLIIGWSFVKSVTISVCIFLGLNTILQYAVACHGMLGLSIAMWTPITTLGFLFDMLVGVFLVIPLLALSFLPFMRILQTRMMYNGGFSRALSSGSEVAASLCILLGLLSGFLFGFISSFVSSLGYINDPSDYFINRSFFYYAADKVYDTSDLKVLCACASIIGISISLILSRWVGRRGNMLLGCSLMMLSLILNFFTDSVAIRITCCIESAGSVMLLMNYLLYSVEICTKGWKGKSIALFLLGTSLGYFVQALLQNSSDSSTTSTNFSDDYWRSVPLYVCGPLILAFVLALWFIPESPVWLMSRKYDEQAKDVLIRLRRRQNVSWDMAGISNELSQSPTGQNYAFRAIFVCTLQGMLGFLMSNTLLLRVELTGSSTSTGASSPWIMHYGLSTSVGIGFAIFLIDNVRRKTILKEFLSFLAVVSLLCGIIGGLGGSQGNFVKVLVFFVHIFAGLSLMGVAMLSPLEMFPARVGPLFFGLSLGMNYAVQALIYYWLPSFGLAYFIFMGLCVAMTAVLFLFCASTKHGAIQLKTEKREQRRIQDRLDEIEQVQRITEAQAMEEHLMQQQQNRIARAQTMQRKNSHHGFSQGVIARGRVPSGGPVIETFEGDDSAPNTAYLRQTSNQLANSSFMDEAATDELLANLMENDIVYPVGQSRSEALMRSQTFPDAELQAETRSMKL